MPIKNLELVKIIEENGLEETQSKTILDNFTELFKKASEWESKAKGIVITDVSQVEEMAQAREARLALKTIRTDGEKVRVKLKEKALREGKAIDGIANVLKALIVPIEEHLDKQEKFAENLEKERIEKVNAQREMELNKYVEDISLYNFKEMTSESFSKLILTVKTAYEAEQEALKKAEQEKIEKEKADQAEQERIRKENESLKKEAEAKEAEREKERKIEADKLAKIEAEREKERKEKEEMEAKIAKDKADEEAKVQADKLAKLEEEKQAKLKPEKEKLLAFAELIKNIETPNDLSIAGRTIAEEAEKKLLEISQEIKLKIKSL